MYRAVAKTAQQAEARRHVEEAGDIIMSDTPFTNIKTCNGELDAQAADDRNPRHAPPRLRDSTTPTALSFATLRTVS